MLGTPSAQMLQDMIEQQYNEKNKIFSRIQNTSFKSGQSLDDESKLIIDELTLALGQPLKKLMFTYLTDVAQNCYPEKWMRDDMPNEPQVNLCKKETHDKYFQTWE